MRAAQIRQFRVLNFPNNVFELQEESGALKAKEACFLQKDPKTENWKFARIALQVITANRI